MNRLLKVALIKPPEKSLLSFGYFSLAVLASAIDDIANVVIIDSTNVTIAKSARRILSQKADILGITAVSFSSVKPVCTLIRRLRRIGYQNKIFVGGHGASVLPQTILASGATAVVYGEGEQTLRELILHEFSEKTAGLYLIKEGKLIKTSPRQLIDLDTLITPAKKWIRTPKDGVYLLETSRGCPHKCNFCETSVFFNNTWRSRSAEKVVRDIEILVERGALIIQITDDNFTANPKRAIEICKRLENRNLPLFFVFSARSDDLLSTPELIPSLAKAHFLRAAIGVETPNEKLSAKIGKNIDLKQHKQAFDSLRKANIYTVASFIVGLPEESVQIRREYVNAASELADSVTFVPFLPLPGTEIGDRFIRFRPQRWSIKCAEKLNREFRQNPKNIARLIEAMQKPSMRGLLAKRSLQKRLADNILDTETAIKIKQAIDSAN